MRPRLTSPGDTPRALHMTRAGNRFNEAQADQPGRLPKLVNKDGEEIASMRPRLTSPGDMDVSDIWSAVGAGFNEAQADQPGRPLWPQGTFRHLARFNEAQADQPGRPPDASTTQRGKVASMRPRLTSPGDGPSRQRQLTRLRLQ